MSGDRVVVRDSRDPDGSPPIDLIEGAGSAQIVIWSGMGAADRTMCRVALEAGDSMRELSHPGEAVWFVAEGQVSLSGHGLDGAQELSTGSMVHVEAGDRYRLGAPAGAAVLIGGPCPVDPALEALVKAE